MMTYPSTGDAGITFHCVDAVLPPGTTALDLLQRCYPSPVRIMPMDWYWAPRKGAPEGTVRFAFRWRLDAERFEEFLGRICHP